METGNIKSYAPKARLEFMDAVAKRLNTFGISINKKGELQVTEAIIQGSVLQISDNNFDSKLAPARQRLVQKSEQLGYAQLVEQVAYTWFNRLCAIRYMEIHGYLGHGFRVLSHSNGDKRFEILDHAQDAAEELGLDRNHIIDLKLAGNKNEELYRELLLGQCHKLHEAMPFLFESLNDETELLLPDNLTRTDSILRGLVDSIPEEDWQQVEVIGWLYQFYISEKKDQVIGKVVKTEDIPAATQLFTPNWIVKYMVQNSLGAQWLATYPDSTLKAQMDYYIEPAEQTDEVNAQLKAITPESLNPEELTLIDPASGSGHILVEAYDLFKAIYLERGYRQRDIPKLILENNLFGLDIDQRAAQLTGFALIMKGREDDRRLFERGVKLNVMAMVDSTSLDVDTLVHGIELSKFGSTQRLTAEDLTALKDLFEHATTFGSLIQVPQNLAEKLPALKQLSEASSQDMFVKEVLEHLAPLVMQAEILAAQYDAVVANPPYMGGKYFNPMIKKYLNKNFEASNSDIYPAFIERGLKLSRPTGRVGIVALQGWLFSAGMNKLRKLLLSTSRINSLVQIGFNSFPSMNSKFALAAAFITSPGFYDRWNASFLSLNNVSASEDKESVFLKLINEFSYIPQRDFEEVPENIIAFELDARFRKVLRDSTTLKELAAPRRGMSTGDNPQFIRSWAEVDYRKLGLNKENRKKALESASKWFPLNMGGDLRKWAGNSYFVLDWENDGERIRNFKTPEGKARSYARNMEHYFKPSLTWKEIGIDYCARFIPAGSISDQTSDFLVSEDISVYSILGYLNSSLSSYLMKSLNPTLHFNVGTLSILPIVKEVESKSIEENVKKAINLSQEEWDEREVSCNFTLHPLLFGPRSHMKVCDAFEVYRSYSEKRIGDLLNLEEVINTEVLRAYSLVGSISCDPQEKTLGMSTIDTYAASTSLLAYIIGCMMGRYSLDEPGLIYANSGNEGFDATRYTKFPADDDGIIPLTDNEWFADDAVNRLVEFISVAWDKAHLEENLDFLAANLSPKKGEGSRDTIRRYLCDKFYKDHMQTYKKRPIYWLFSSGKQKAFQCLVYLHRYNESTLARMRTEYVIPLLGKYEAYAEQLGKQLGMAESTQDKKRIERDLKSMNKKQSELREFDNKLKHYADMRISIDLDDGVKENYGKFGDLLAEVKNITGEKPEIINAN